MTDNIISLKIKKRKKKSRIEDIASPINDELIKEISKNLSKQIDKDNFDKKYGTVKNVLKLVGLGAFFAASIVMPNLPLALKPFIDYKRKEEYEAWKRFNIPYLKRTLYRLKKQKLLEITEDKGMQVVALTESGKRKVLKYAIDDLAIEKPSFWDGNWRLISYDIPKGRARIRNIFREYLSAWGFYPLHKSAFLHAYPCEKQLIFLREYLGIGDDVRIFTVSKIENDELFRDFFGV